MEGGSSRSTEELIAAIDKLSSAIKGNNTPEPNRKGQKFSWRSAAKLIFFGCGIYLQEDGLNTVPELFRGGEAILSPNITYPADYGDNERKALKEEVPLLEKLLLACATGEFSDGNPGATICSYYDRATGKVVYVVDGRPVEEAIAVVNSPGFGGCDNLRIEVLASLDDDLERALALSDGSIFSPGDGFSLKPASDDSLGGSC